MKLDLIVTNGAVSRPIYARHCGCASLYRKNFESSMFMEISMTAINDKPIGKFCHVLTFIQNAGSLRNYEHVYRRTVGHPPDGQNS